MFKPSRNPAKGKVICAQCEILQPKEPVDSRGAWVRGTLVQIWMELFQEGCWLVLSGRARAAVRVWECRAPR